MELPIPPGWGHLLGEGEDGARGHHGIVVAVQYILEASSPAPAVGPGRRPWKLTTPRSPAPPRADRARRGRRSSGRWLPRRRRNPAERAAPCPRGERRPIGDERGHERWFSSGWCRARRRRGARGRRPEALGGGRRAMPSAKLSRPPQAWHTATTAFGVPRLQGGLRGLKGLAIDFVG